MKNTKKLLALVLALVMAFSLMAVTAAAAGTAEHEHVCSTETIQPRIPGVRCRYCGMGMVLIHHTWDGTVHHGIFQCDNDDCSQPGNTVEYDWQM